MSWGPHSIVHGKCLILKLSKPVRNKNQNKKSVWSCRACFLNSFFWSKWIPMRGKWPIPHITLKISLRWIVNVKAKTKRTKQGNTYSLTSKLTTYPQHSTQCGPGLRMDGRSGWRKRGGAHVWAHSPLPTGFRQSTTPTQWGTEQPLQGTVPEQFDF